MEVYYIAIIVIVSVYFALLKSQRTHIYKDEPISENKLEIKKEDDEVVGDDHDSRLKVYRKACKNYNKGDEN